MRTPPPNLTRPRAASAQFTFAALGFRLVSTEIAGDVSDEPAARGGQIDVLQWRDRRAGALIRRSRSFMDERLRKRSLRSGGADHGGDRASRIERHPKQLEPERLERQWLNASLRRPVANLERHDDADRELVGPRDQRDRSRREVQLRRLRSMGRVHESQLLAVSPGRDRERPNDGRGRDDGVGLRLGVGTRQLVVESELNELGPRLGLFHPQEDRRQLIHAGRA